MWKKSSIQDRIYWERSDTAYIWPNIALSSENITWIAFDQFKRPLTKAIRNSKMRAPKRWKTTEAAMKAVDKQFPLPIHLIGTVLLPIKPIFIEIKK